MPISSFQARGDSNGNGNVNGHGNSNGKLVSHGNCNVDGLAMPMASTANIQRVHGNTYGNVHKGDHANVNNGGPSNVHNDGHGIQDDVATLCYITYKLAPGLGIGHPGASPIGACLFIYLFINHTAWSPRAMAV